jgi:hypothetical protein
LPDCVGVLRAELRHFRAGGYKIAPFFANFRVRLEGRPLHRPRVRPHPHFERGHREQGLPLGRLGPGAGGDQSDAPAGEGARGRLEVGKGVAAVGDVAGQSLPKVLHRPVLRVGRDVADGLLPGG